MFDSDTPKCYDNFIVIDLHRCRQSLHKKKDYCWPNALLPEFSWFWKLKLFPEPTDLRQKLLGCFDLRIGFDQYLVMPYFHHHCHHHRILC